MGTGANYTEYTTGRFAINVHEVGTIPITIVSGQVIQVTNIDGECICTTPIGDHGLPFKQTSDGSLFTINLDFEAVEKALLQDEPQPPANTNILPNDITPDFPPADFKLQIIMSNSGNFSVVITNGGDSQVGLLNANSPVGITLIPGALYTFDVLVHKGDSINFQYDNTGGTIQTLRVQEIDASSY